MTNPTRYRYRDLKPGDAYYEAWREFNKRELAFGLSIVIGVPLFILIAVGLARVGLNDEIFEKVLMVALIVVVFWAMRWSSTVPCPSCGRPYDGKPLERNKMRSKLSRRCCYCGLPKWAPDASGSDFTATAPGARVSKAIESLVMRTYSVDEQQEVLVLLAKYGQEDWHRETERVQRAALKLAEGSLGELRKYIAEANVDYRDVICMAEYPDA